MEIQAEQNYLLVNVSSSQLDIRVQLGNNESQPKQLHESIFSISYTKGRFDVTEMEERGTGKCFSLFVVINICQSVKLYKIYFSAFISTFDSGIKLSGTFSLTLCNIWNFPSFPFILLFELC